MDTGFVTLNCSGDANTLAALRECCSRVSKGLYVYVKGKIQSRVLSCSPLISQWCPQILRLTSGTRGNKKHSTLFFGSLSSG